MLGCGYCGTTGQCMPSASNSSSYPAVGMCDASTWSPSPTQCSDPCSSYHACAGCMALLGCGWCSSTCSCSSSQVDLTPRPGACASTSWVSSLHSRAISCSSPTDGSSCSTKALVASPAAAVVGGLMILSSAGSTPCMRCAQLTCGPNGVCKAGGTFATCMCLNGWSGPSCSIAPGSCYNVTCSGQGWCVLSMLGDSMRCACNPGATGVDCGTLVPYAPPQPPPPNPNPIVSQLQRYLGT